MNKQTHNFCNSIQLAGAIFGGLLIGLPAISQTAQAQQQPVNVSGSKINPCPKIFYEKPHNDRVRVPQGCPPNAFTNRINTQGTSPTSTQTQLGVGGEVPGSNVGNQPSTSQGTVVPAPQPLNSPNQGIPSSQIDPNTGYRINGPAGGYTQRWQALQDSRDNSGDNTRSNYNNQSSRVETRTSTNSQIDPNTGYRVNGPAGGYTSRRLEAQQTQQTTSNRYQNAVAAVSPTDGKVNVLLINQTNTPIVYQAIGDTQQRILPGRSQVTLQGLSTPANVNFYRQDRGLLMVTPQSPTQGTLQVTLQETTDFAMDRTALRIENNGAVYLN